MNSLLAFLIGFLFGFQSLMVDGNLLLFIRFGIILSSLILVLRRKGLTKLMVPASFFYLLVLGLMLSFSYSRSVIHDNYYLYKIPLFFFNVVFPYLSLLNIFSGKHFKESDFIKGLVYGGIATIVLWMVGLRSFSLGVSLSSFESRYVYSTLVVNPIWLSRVAFSLSIVAIFSSNATKSKRKLQRYIFLVFSTFVGIATFSRGPLIAFILAIAYGTLVVKKNLRRRVKILSLITALLIAIALLISMRYILELDFSKSIQQRFSVESLLHSERLIQWESAIPDRGNLTTLFGSGPYNFSRTIKYPHNIFMEVLFEAGLLGLVILVVFIFLVASSHSGLLNVLFVFFVVCSFFSGDLNSNYQLFWLAGIIVASSSGSKTQEIPRC